MWKKQRFAIFKTFSGKKLFTTAFLPEKQPTFTELLQNINGVSSYCTLTSKVWANLWIDVAALSWWQATRYQLFCNEWDTDESHANNTSTIEISWSDIFFSCSVCFTNNLSKIFFRSTVQILRNCDLIFTCKVNGRKWPLFFFNFQFYMSNYWYQTICNLACL